MNLKNVFNSPRIKVSKGNAGYDNARENIDPIIRTIALHVSEIVCSNNIKLSNTKNTLPQLLISNTQEQFAINIDSYRTDDTIMVINSKMTATHSSFKVRGTATTNQTGAMIGAFHEQELSTGQCFYASQAGLGHGLQIAMQNTSSTNVGIRIDNSASVTTDFLRLYNSAGEKFAISSTGIPRTNGSAGVSGSFTTTDGKTVTVTNGIITAIV